MKQEYIIIKKLKNAKGKRLLERTILEYSKEIINTLEQYPDELYNLLNILEITEESFYEYISGEKRANIGLYDQALNCLIKVKKNDNKK